MQNFLLAMSMLLLHSSAFRMLRAPIRGSILALAKRRAFLSSLPRFPTSMTKLPDLPPFQVSMLSTQKDASSTESKKQSIKEKVKALWNAYGFIGIGTYVGIYIVTLSSVFFSLDMDIFNAATFGFDPAATVHKVCDIFESVTGSAALPQFIRDHPKVGTFAIAWVMTKFTEPIRLGLAIAIVPSVAKAFGREVPRAP